MQKNATLALLALLTISGCTTTQPGSSTPAQTITGAPVHGLTLTEEATVLRLEDRREFDAEVAQRWMTHPNALHRARMALALGRIGSQTFADTNANGVKEPEEKMAGVDLLVSAAADREYEVRRNVAFSLGEIGDPAGIPALLTLARDTEHADVASEAIEALSKVAASVPFESYKQLTTDARDGVRTRAIRFLFRFSGDEPLATASTFLGAAGMFDRREAAYSLSRKAYPAARAKLELLLTDGDTLTRSYAARALGLIADPGSLQPLFTAIADAHPWVRTNAARAIAQIGDKHPVALKHAKVSEDVIRLISLTDDPDPGTRVTAIETLAMYTPFNEQAKNRLQEIAITGSSVQREVATGQIAKHLGGDPKSPLASLLQTDSPWVKVRVLEGTSKAAGGEQIRSRFAKDANATVRANVIGGIPDERLQQESALISAALDDEDVVVRSSAIDRFAARTDVSIDEKLRVLQAAESRSRNESMNDARLSAISAIAALDFPDRERMLRGWLADRDPVVRRVAADSIVSQLKMPRPQFTPLGVDRPISEYEEIAKWSREPHSATIHTVRGEIHLVLLSQEAPLTAWNFATLAKSGYYDNTSFMRVVPNFVIQGGDPRNDMSGGPGYAIRDEINTQKYTRGALGMALSGPDTGGSQFFITHSPQHHLDGGYTIFGRVAEGMGGVVDQMERGDKVTKITIDERKLDQPDFAAVERTPLPTVIGPITPERLSTLVPEYGERRTGYTPDRDVLQMISSAIKPDDRVEVYLGTWCSDSQREVPKYLRVLDELQKSYSISLPTSYVALNRAKQEPAKLIEGKHIDKVATFIVYRGSEEIGRIVETPTSLIEDDLLQILSK